MLEPREDLSEDVSGGWFNGQERWFHTATIETSDVNPEFIDIVSGGASVPAQDVTAGPVHRTVPTKEGGQVDFVLYKMAFEPLRFDIFNKWWKKLLRLAVGKKRAQSFLLRKALTVSYTGKALMNHHANSTIPEPVGRFRPGS